MDIKMGKLLLSRLIYNIKDKKAFTLVELSIVIVIIGLLVGGVVAGKSLVRQAQLRSVVSEYNKYQAAMVAFRLQYNALPGDMNNATAYWGGVTGNGNGDKKFTDDFESVQTWEHLALAGLIEGSYTGVPSGQNLAVIGANVPASKLSGAGWRTYNSNANVYGRIKNHLKLASPATVGGWTYINKAVLSAKEASSLDTKMDDGSADTGLVVAMNSFTTAFQTGCVTIGSGQLTKPAAYILDSATSDQINCALVFYGTF